MSGRKSKRKGWRTENAFVKRMNALGFGAERIPLSGSAGGSYSGDAKVWTIDGEYRVECKSLKNGWATLYKWLAPDNIDFLSLKANNKPGLIVMTEETFAKLVGEGEV